MKKRWVLLLFLPLAFLWFRPQVKEDLVQKNRATWWEIQSVDTMKYSRDLAGAKLEDQKFDVVIDKQVGDIAALGATHVAIGTPYDEKFVPFLRRWVKAARKYGLKVWFRGNFSGWEGWYNSKEISREEHLALLQNFLKNNKDLFLAGDIFSSCPECENGGPGDPRKTGDIIGHRQFLISEYEATKGIIPNYFSMNADVARLIMDPPTTKALGGVVVIDHYVDTPEKLINDISDIATDSMGKVFLGEFGAPIPDIHGNLTEEQQAKWINTALNKLADEKSLIGLNYWVGVGGSTKIFNEDGSGRRAAEVLKSYFQPKSVVGVVVDDFGLKVPGALVKSLEKAVSANQVGGFVLPYRGQIYSINASSPGYQDGFGEVSEGKPTRIVLHKKDRNILDILGHIPSFFGFDSGNK